MEENPFESGEAMVQESALQTLTLGLTAGFSYYSAAIQHLKQQQHKTKTKCTCLDFLFVLVSFFYTELSFVSVVC